MRATSTDDSYRHSGFEPNTKTFSHSAFSIQRSASASALALSLLQYSINSGLFKVQQSAGTGTGQETLKHKLRSKLTYSGFSSQQEQSAGTGTGQETSEA